MTVARLSTRAKAMNHDISRVGLASLAVGLLLASGCGRGPAAPNATNFFTGLSHVPSSPDTVLGGEHTFGSVDGLAVLGPHAQVVSDATDGHLKLFVDGREALSFGRLGSAPDDFSTLGAVVAVGADTLVVLDPDRGRLVTFTRAADTVAPLGAIDLPFRVSGVCAMDGRLFVLGGYDSTLVHETTVHGGLVRSFGRLEGGTPFEVGLDAAAEIACSSDAGAVAIASRVPGELRVFSPSGALLRHDSIPSFARSSYAGRTVATTSDTTAVRSWDVVRGLQWFGKDLLVQLGRYPRTGESGLASRWLSAAGVWKEGLPAWPRILAHTASGRVYTLSEDPYPAVKVYWVKRSE